MLTFRKFLENQSYDDNEFVYRAVRAVKNAMNKLYELYDGKSWINEIDLNPETAKAYHKYFHTLDSAANNPTKKTLEASYCQQLWKIIISIMRKTGNNLEKNHFFNKMNHKEIFNKAIQEFQNELNKNHNLDNLFGVKGLDDVEKIDLTKFLF